MDMTPASSAGHSRPSTWPKAGTPGGRLSGTGPWRWFATILSSFIDVVEPAVARLTRRRRLVVVEANDGNLAFHRVIGSRVTSMGAAKAPDEAIRKTLRTFKADEVEFRLPAGKVMTSTLSIPQAALQYADQLVASRLDRLTPWRPDAIVHGFAIAPALGADGQRELNFAATSSQIADNAMKHLEAFGLAPSTMGATGAPISQRLPIDLFRGARQSAGRKSRRRIGIVAVGGLLLSVLTCLLSLSYTCDSSGQIADLDMRLTKARTRLVNGISSSDSRQTEFALIAAKVPDRARFVLISRLAEIVPDDSYLDELDLKDNALRIAGTSADAFGLIKLIENDAAFSDTKFAAPVTRRDDGRDGFDLSATIAIRSSETGP